MPISIPKLFQRAFAQNGGKQDVPITGDNSGGRASYDVGFPPVTRIPIVAGGIPPFGTDFNGVLYDITSAIQYIQSGLSFPYNQDFADAIGGYGKGSLVSLDSDLSVVYKSKVDNNLTPPPSANWEVSGEVPQATKLVAGIAKVASSAILMDGTNDDSFATAKGLKDAGLWPLGVGQTWQNMTASRSLNTNFTNNTTRPIFIAIRVISTSAGATTSALLVDGVVISSNTRTQANEPDTHFAIVPVGSVYRIDVSTNTTIGAWMELRA